ncbi:hypothetical protein [Salisediminibacterium halotolerans]|uniref:hypothetical protein n=1 Tax=Salisediminibacterium halotolerans TaxID=517425 RepID=UPI000EB4E05F|nr:hypothetical protein [Salisediminibacterium halotolerans]RLJ78319.1 hypothetical protein BCL39_0791 [Actinophytocola xinjiangensis]RPE88342.1 hypothetical protein EDD67_0668 [Salisediminibacterium halotolerans]TWG37295.1 hypothetical protein BCL52_0789 [Salisediminibacterium halotolerans]GEL08759.1 hypothetical protein SHA02_21750 [Salisediminibacterium halotolerans]
MEKETEQQLVEEMQQLNQKIDRIEARLDDEEKPLPLLWLVIKSLAAGVFVVGPILAVIFVLFSYFI